MRNLYVIQFVGTKYNDKKLPNWFHLKYFAGFGRNGMILVSNRVDRAYLTSEKDSLRPLLKKLHDERKLTFHVLYLKEQIMPVYVFD